MESADDIARGIEVLDGLVKGVDDLQLFVDPQFRDRVKSCVLREESEPEQFCKGLRGHTVITNPSIFNCSKNYNC